MDEYRDIDFRFGVPIVIDNGTGFIKAGFACDDVPKSEFPCMVGKTDRNQYSFLLGVSQKESFVGEEAQNRRGLLSISYPMKHGMVTTEDDWDDMVDIWNYTITQELERNPQEHPIMLSEAPGNPIEHRQKMMEVLFEQFNVPAMYVEIQAVLSLYSQGMLTGTVLDSGDGVTHVVPIVDGHIIQKGIRRVDLAGRDLTEYLIGLLMHSGTIVQRETRRRNRIMTPSMSFLQTTAGLDIARQLKEKLCEVHLDYDEYQNQLSHSTLYRGDYEEMVRQHSVQCTLDGLPAIRIGDERYKCAEALFKPSLVGQDYLGIHELLYNAIEASPFANQYNLYRNIVLSGGTTTMRNLPERLEAEITKLAPTAMEPRVIAPGERRYSCWIGGAILSALSAFQDHWNTKSDYDEKGSLRLIREQNRENVVA